MAIPFAYSPEIAETICEMIAEGRTLKFITAIDGMPKMTTIFKWLQLDEEFAKNYALAREASADSDADEIKDLKDEVIIGKLAPDAARVAMDALKWAAGKRKPKVYGDRLQLDGDLTHRLSDDRVESRLAQLLGKARAAGAAGGDGAA